MKMTPKFRPYILILLSIVIYLNTLKNGFVLDDAIVLTQNQFVKEGVKGIRKILTIDTFTGFFGSDKKLIEGGRYRPFSMVLFAIEYQIIGESAAYFHWVNILLYALLAFLLYKFLVFILNWVKHGSVENIAFIACLLFVVHPVHTEVVANIKGRDEILAMIFGISYLWLILLAIKRNFSVKYVTGAAICLLLGLLSKENVIVYFLITILVYYNILIRFWNTHSKKIVLNTFIVVCSVAVYGILRINAVGLFTTAQSADILNNPFAGAASNQFIPTILFVLIMYFKLVFAPWKLTHDYYPYHIELQNWDNILVWVSLFLVGLLLYRMVKDFKKSPLYSVSLLFYFLHILLISNLLFPVGTFMSERFLFAPILGLILPISILANSFLERTKGMITKSLIFGLVGLVSIVFAISVIKRNGAWKDNYTLFTTDVKVSENSAKNNCAAGSEILRLALQISDTTRRNAQIKTAIPYLKKSLEIYPTYSDALIGLGNAYFYLNKSSKKSVEIYRRLLEIAPYHERGLNNIKLIANKSPNPAVKKEAYKLYLNSFPRDFRVNHELGRVYGMQLQQPDSAVIFLQSAYRIDSANANVVKDLGIAYVLKGDELNAERFFRKSIQLSPSDASALINLGVLLNKKGKRAEANYYFLEAEKLKAASSPK